MKGVQLTIKQIENMKHAIGFDLTKIKRGKYSAYRNYFTTSGLDKSWDDLVNKGYAQVGNFGKGKWYSVSQDGIKALETIYEVNITEVD